MKKLYVILTLVLAVAMIAGCAPAPTQAPAAPAAATTAPAAPADTTAPAAPAATTAPAAPAASAKGKTMGIVMPNADHGFTGESIAHAQAFAKDMAAKEGFTYTFLTAGETSEQNNQVDTLINQKVDVIVMWPINGDELRSAAQKIVDAKIPLVIYDRLITGFTPTVEFMGDNTTIGKMTGEYFNKYFKADIDAGKDINILEFKGDLSTVPTQRSDGFKSTAATNFKILQAFTTNWQRATAMDQMETFLNTSSVADIESIKAIFTHDDEVVLGVLDAIAAYKGTAKLDIRLVSGVGARKENLDTFADFKTNHNIDQVTYAFSPAMIDSAVQLGIDILNGKTPSGLILGPTVEVDNSSAEAFRTNPIYITRYSLAAPAAPAAATTAPAAPAATTAPAAPAASANGKTMGIVMPNADHGFTGESIAHAQAFAKDMAAKEGFTYTFLTAGETSEQNNQVDTLINQKVDVIVMWPINGDELRSAAQKIVDAKIPLVIYDRLITGFTPTVEFMGDNTTIGKMTGEYFNKYFKADIDAGKDINILEFKGDLSTVPTQRSDGFKSTAAKNFKILQAFTTNWQRATAMDQMETFLNTSSPADIESIKAIFTHDDEVVLGVLDAIAAYKGTAKLDIRLVSGVGARKENLDTFADFKTKYNIDQVTYAFSPAMIDSAVQLGIDILNGKTPSGLILGPTVEVDNSSAEAFRTNPIYITRYSLAAPTAPAADTTAPAAPATPAADTTAPAAPAAPAAATTTSAAPAASATP